MVIVAPIGEEVVYRGFMYRGLARCMEPVFAILIISFIFGALHVDNEIMWHVACGYLYGVLRWRTESTWAPISAHVTGNLLAFTFSDLIQIG
jgi:membrane protease YdiL (CAAX protease family)